MKSRVAPCLESLEDKIVMSTSHHIAHHVVHHAVQAHVVHHAVQSHVVKPDMMVQIGTPPLPPGYPGDVLLNGLTPSPPGVLPDNCDIYLASSSN